MKTLDGSSRVNMKYVDLRSDTVTQPTPAMREAMARAEVGDDVMGEDPTVNRLQEMAAARTGKEAGLFVSSGTMGNLCAILAHCNRGDEAILGAHAHTFVFEGGGISALGGIHSRQLEEQPDGSLALDDLAPAIRPDDIHQPPTRLISIENTHNRCGGTFQSPQYLRDLVDFAKIRGLVVHLDGARVFNAAIAQGVDVEELTLPVDSVTFCLSKGLCAPVGSVLCGNKEFIDKARRIRKQVGGGMRQAGVLAAAGIIALDTMVDRLAEDHLRAKKLAEGLRDIRGFTIEAEGPATNMVFIQLSEAILPDAYQIASKLKEYGVLAGIPGERTFRLVTHYWIDDEGIERTVEAFKKAIQ
jgi:threonine aldolase